MTDGSEGVILNKKMNKILASKINNMAKADQKMRQIFDLKGIWDNELDNKNTEEMKSIVRKYGWPTIGMVGKRASKNAWLLVQHADHDLSFQKECLVLMQDIFAKNPKDIEKSNIAYLTDRTLLAEKKPQIYGTQFKVTKKGGLSLLPVKNRKSLNKMRAEVGLPPIEEMLELAKGHKQSKPEPFSKE